MGGGWWKLDMIDGRISRTQKLDQNHLLFVKRNIIAICITSVSVRLTPCLTLLTRYPTVKFHSLTGPGILEFYDHQSGGE